MSDRDTTISLGQTTTDNVDVTLSSAIADFKKLYFKVTVNNVIYITSEIPVPLFKSETSTPMGVYYSPNDRASLLYISDTKIHVRISGSVTQVRIFGVM